MVRPSLRPPTPSMPGVHDQTPEPPDLHQEADLGLTAHLSLQQHAATQRPADNQLRRIVPSDLPTISAARSPAAPDQCLCDGTGWYVEAVPLGHAHFGKLLPCACTVARRERATQTQLLTTLKSELGQLAGKTFESFDVRWDAAHAPGLQQAWRTLRQYAAQPGEAWLYVWGGTGSGKSHLVSAVALTLAQRGMSAYYRTVPAMLNAIKAGYGARPGEASFDARLLAVCMVPLLILDDLGAEQDTPNNQALIFEIIDYRAKRPELLTLITSNLAIDDLPYFRVASRIQERALDVLMDADDYRVYLQQQHQRRIA